MHDSALSPLDGRYAQRLEPLRSFFSERALVTARCRVELCWVQALCQPGLFPELDEDEAQRVQGCLADPLGESGWRRVKEIEARTRHDVKAVEIYLRERLQLGHAQVIHFGLTSEDVNNLAWSTLFQAYRDQQQLPQLAGLIRQLCEQARGWRAAAFPAHTHRQPASPTTAGKELAVFAHRLLRLYSELRALPFRGKLGGATGNHSALLAAFPQHDWPAVSADFVSSLGLQPNAITTQVEDHDSWVAWFDCTRRVNSAVLDLDRDAWAYISRGLFKQRKAPGQVGSSTMPHKVNPINFENSEGNLEISCALLAFLGSKLGHSRMQRDLSDSTVQRNVGVAMGHAWLALQETGRGLGKLDLDAARCRALLAGLPELLAEPLQTVLRLEGIEDPYELLRRATQGRAVTRELLAELVASLPIPQATKERLGALTVAGYVGVAPLLVDRVLREAEEVLAS